MNFSDASFLTGLLFFVSFFHVILTSILAISRGLWGVLLGSLGISFATLFYLILGESIQGAQTVIFGMPLLIYLFIKFRYSQILSLRRYDHFLLISSAIMASSALFREIALELNLASNLIMNINLMYVFFILIRDDQKALILLAETQAMLADRKTELEEINRKVSLGNVELERAIKKLGLVLETANDAFISTDGGGFILDWNKKAERLFGLSRDEVLNKKMNVILIPDKYQKEIDAEMMEFVSSSDKYVIDKLLEVRGFRKDGSEFPAEMALSILRYDNDFIFNAFVRDISDRKKLEKMKDEFLSTVSHELRTPLAIIKGAVSNLRDGILGELTEKQLKVVETTDRNVTRLSRLINDLLDLSRLESGKASYKPTLFNLYNLIQEIAGGFKTVTQHKTIEIELLNIDSKAELFADIDMITQLFTNLLSNAVRYANNKIYISVKAEATLPAEWAKLMISDYPVKSLIHITVSDDGPGIDNSNLELLFNKFQQINRPQGGSGYKGTGLGLAICREIINLHQGRIWAESQIGAGAHFHVLIPNTIHTSDCSII